MGFNGYIVLARTHRTVTELFDLPPEKRPLYEPTDGPDGWRVMRLRLDADQEIGDGQVRQAADALGAPVLVCQVVMSDYAIVRGCAPGGELWSAELNVRLAVESGVFEEFGVSEEDEELTAAEWQECVEVVTARWEADRTEALEHALSWAAAAGHEVDPAGVAEVVYGKVLYAEDSVHDLFRSLAIRIPPDG
ncbi:hypothetical protein [Kitasatospora sp. NBC_01300]|uniref:hypothetical protein n=1 Tax=Kitasatospora sp. NBC_01300 TaxID=2903574 RepID=UPI002F915539|nr:hypothetical protein OG556_39115 [Kitasatospora sp. NBC_01300]